MTDEGDRSQKSVTCLVIVSHTGELHDLLWYLTQVSYMNGDSMSHR